MPCTYYTEAERAAMASASIQKQAEQIDKLTALLCDVMTQYEQSEFWPSDELFAWWEHHKAHDAKMLAAKNAKEKAERAKRAEERKKKKAEELAIYEKLHKKYGPKDM